MAKIKSASGRREKKISVSASQKVYEGAKALAAIRSQSLNDFVVGLIEGEVQKNLSAINKMVEVQNMYKTPADEDDSGEVGGNIEPPYHTGSASSN